MRRENVVSGTQWEESVGYSRAVRRGPFVFVSGTTATDGMGGIVGEGDAYRQTVQTLNNIRVALEAAGATLEDVVRTRIFVTDIQLWREVGRAHSEVFGEIKPASSMVEVSRLVDARMLVEVEVEALISSEYPGN